MKRTGPRGERADYGIDAPYVLRNLVVISAASLLVALAFPSLRGLFQVTFSSFATAAIWLYASKVGKPLVRDRMLGLINWVGDEQVLDAGCGGGLLLIGAAKRLTGGRAVGIDLWRSEDLSRNRPESTLWNARAEGVADRVEVREGDARKMPFENETFDVALSLNVIHNILKREDREKALREIVRVLKPGGKMVIADFRNTPEYMQILRNEGMENVHRQRVFWLFWPTYSVIARKAG